MAFAQVIGTPTGSSHDSGVTDHTVTLPTLAAGELALVLFVSHEAATFPAGWTRVASTGANNIAGSWAHHICDGTEGASITVTTVGAVASAHLVYRIQGHGSSSQVPQSLSSATCVVTATPDPTTCTPTGGAKDYLWIVFIGADSGYVVTAASANYTDLVTSDSGSTANVSMAVSSFRRELNAVSQNAGACTLEASEGTYAITIAVHPGTEGNPAAAVIRRRIVKSQAVHRASRW